MQTSAGTTKAVIVGDNGVGVIIAKFGYGEGHDDVCH